jgi:hypothetical protein
MVDKPDLPNHLIVSRLQAEFGQEISEVLARPFSQGNVVEAVV